MKSLGWGWMAEFESPEALLEAAREAHAAGYAVEAYAPFHIEGLAEAVGVARSPIAAITFVGALVGGLFGYAMQWYSAVIDRPLDFGGRPLHSWPMFVPVSFELAVLVGAFAAVGAFLWTSGLPRLRHPVFDAPDFELASRNRFFLVLPHEGDPERAARAARWLGERGPVKVAEVPT